MDVYFSFSNILSWAEGVWGILTLLFWSIAYILIVIAGFFSRKVRKVSMPYIASVLNAAWEIAATIYTHGNPGFIIWFIIDVFILFWGFIFSPSVKKKIIYCASVLLSTCILLVAFEKSTTAFLFTVYLIDVIMAFEFLVKRTKLSSKFKIAIAVTKLLGDLFAGLTFSYMYDFVIVFATVSFVCNCIYLIACIKEYFKPRNA